MKDAFAMDILYRFEQFIHIVLNLLCMQIFISNQTLIQILLHQFEHKCQFAFSLE
jgi:hypothetical protein